MAKKGYLVVPRMKHEYAGCFMHTKIMLGDTLVMELNGKELKTFAINYSKVSVWDSLTYFFSGITTKEIEALCHRGMENKIFIKCHSKMILTEKTCLQ